MRFQVFSLASKKVYTTAFQWQEDINVIVISILSSTKACHSFFEILVFSQDIWGNVHYVPEINLFS